MEPLAHHCWNLHQILSFRNRFGSILLEWWTTLWSEAALQQRSSTVVWAWCWIALCLVFCVARSQVSRASGHLRCRCLLVAALAHSQCAHPWGLPRWWRFRAHYCTPWSAPLVASPCTCCAAGNYYGLAGCSSPALVGLPELLGRSPDLCLLLA